MNHVTDLFGDGPPAGSREFQREQLEGASLDRHSETSKRGREDGRVLRDDALETHEVFRGRVLHRLRASAISLAYVRPNHEIDGDDVQILLDRLIASSDEWERAAGYDRRFLGAIWRDGNWEKTGRTRQSRLKRRHAGPVWIWRLKS